MCDGVTGASPAISLRSLASPYASRRGRARLASVLPWDFLSERGDWVDVYLWMFAICQASSDFRVALEPCARRDMPVLSERPG